MEINEGEQITQKIKNKTRLSNVDEIQNRENGLQYQESKACHFEFHRY